VPLIGLDLTCSRALALSCEHHTVLTSDDLDRVIRTQIANKQKRQGFPAMPLLRENGNLSILNHAMAVTMAGGPGNGTVEDLR
jgi:hypothetical protein